MAVLNRRLGGVAGCAFAMMVAATAAVSAQSDGAAEADIKAAFLYNFAKYVEWPSAADAAGDFRVCVTGDRALIASLDAIIAGETIGGRRVVRQTTTSVAAAKGCHILFLDDVIPERADLYLESLDGSPILTVGDAPDFLDRGGMIGFVRDGDRVRFDVEASVVQRAGLTMSSRLLRVARRVLPAGAPQ